MSVLKTMIGETHEIRICSGREDRSSGKAGYHCKTYSLGMVIGADTPTYGPREYDMTEFVFTLGAPRFEGTVQRIINPVGVR